MKLFRNLLFWCMLALVGALLAQLLLSQDPGHVLVRWRGFDYTTTVFKAVALLLGILLALWLVWWLLSLPFRTWGRRRDLRARARIGEGFDALHLGHHARAETLLAQASEDPGLEVAARVGAAHAAIARGDSEAAQAHLQGFNDRHPGAQAVARAELALSQGRDLDALAALDAPSAQPLPPRGLVLRSDILARNGQAGQAYGLLGPLRQQRALADLQLDQREREWARAALLEASDANVLADLWDRLPKPLKADHGVVIAYADRAVDLRWDAAATSALEHAIDAQWHDDLIARYGMLPLGRLEQRRANAERWLQAHPASPALLITLARLARAQGQWPQAEEFLHRALAQGAGHDAWEELGHGFTAAGDDTRASQCYANALRALRGEAVTPIGGRGLRQQILDEAVIEDRDEHGVPRLRG